MKTTRGFWFTTSISFSAVAVFAQMGAAAPVATVSDVGQGILPSSDIRHFVNDYGVPLIVGDKPISWQAMTPDSNSPRLQELAMITANNNATWRKEYLVEPATANSPVTNLARASEMVDSSASVDISVSAMPIHSLIALIARADEASVSFPEGVPTGMTEINLADGSVADAIAAVASATHTHWQAAYYVAPVKHEPVVQVAALPAQTTDNSDQLDDNNGQGFIIHLTPTPLPTATVIAAAPGGPDKANQPAPVSMQPSGNGAAASPYAYPSYAYPMTPAVVSDPYGYNGLMYAPDYSFGGSTVINPFN